MRKKYFSGAVLVLLVVCLFTGCFFPLPERHIGKIKGDIRCEFRTGKNAKSLRDPIKTDAVFDKDKFVELYNEDYKYDPTYYSKHLDKLDLKIVYEKEPEEYEEMAASEVSFRAYSDEQFWQVSLYCRDSKLYFFVVCMGGRSKPEHIGYYYKEVPEKMASYWKPIYDKVLADDEANFRKKYGSFTPDRAYSYDKEYYAETLTTNSDKVTLQIYNKDDIRIAVIHPCRAYNFRGICWEKDNYNLWVQSTVNGCVCYSKKGDEWVENESAVKPDYMIEAQE